MRPILVTLSFALAAIGGVTIAEATPGAPAVTQDASERKARLAAALRRLDFLKGPWVITRYSRSRDGVWTANEVQTLTIGPSMNDLYLEATFVTPGYIYEMVFSYDTAMETYRVVSRDDQSGLIDVYQGDFNADGALVLTNLQSGTHYASGELQIHNRLIFAPTADGWSVSIDASADKGETWRPQGRHDARRP